ncbi:unnamed protein product [Acanthosepion pharaonis]|uniref:Uncharacterized protein n=1 Tax=Acanthosepion pharaonis TaxID=158019 RepID=A0A812AT79_ACAPH|nr:unnamed protein product [Sepia pharaonis]
MVSNSLPFILQSRYQAHFGKAHFWKNVLYVAFVFCCLISTAQSERYWEIKRENGNIELCCFCLHQDLKNREHIIKECEVKFGQVNIPGYIGPPICSCLSSNKYPRCPDIHVCGNKSDCPNNKIYERCSVKELLTLKTMKCNDSLQWEHDIDCNATCMPSNNIKNGIAMCQLLGNKVVCNCTCKEGFVTSQTKNLSCIEAKNTICNPVKTEQYLLEILLPIVMIIIIGSIIIIIYCIWKKSCCFGHVPNAQESSYRQNDRDLNHIPGAQESNQTQIDEESSLLTDDGELNHTPGAQESNQTQIDEESSLPTDAQMSNHTPGDEESIHTPGDQETNHTTGDQESNYPQNDRDLNHTPGAQESNQTQIDEKSSLPMDDQPTNYTPGGVESLPYEDGYASMGFPLCPESLQGKSHHSAFLPGINLNMI